MGFDISYHPVDVAFIRDRVIPFVTGQRDIDDLIATGTRIARTRYIANAWGLGMSKFHSRRDEPAPKRSFLDRLLKRPAAEAPRPEFEFETDLSVWGRPFFITDDDVSRFVDRYLGARTDAEVDAIAKEMVEKIQPGLATNIRPDFESGIPNDETFRQSFTWRLDLFRAAFAAIAKGEMVTTPDGNSVEPLGLFSTDFPLAAVTFAAHFRPGWMARGYVWPTHLIEEAGLTTDLFSDAGELFAPLASAEPRMQFELYKTIEQNYSLGGYVRPADVPRLRQFLEANHAKLLAVGAAQGWEYDCGLVLQKIREAVRDAEARRYAFIEASEVYSGPLGVMN